MGHVPARAAAHVEHGAARRALEQRRQERALALDAGPPAHEAPVVHA